MNLAGHRRTLFLAALVVSLVIVLVGSAAAATSYFAPETYRKIADRIIGTREEIKVKLNDLETKYLAEGSSEDTVLVKFKSSVSEETKAKVHSKLGTKVKKKVNKIDVEVVNIPSGAKVGETIEKLKAEADVEYAEPNFLAAALLDPNDSLYSSQWNLGKIGASYAWDDSQGGVGPIAVVDTGVDSGHPDLSGQILQGYNFVGDSANTDDDQGHGTHVSGIISASTKNAVGVASIGFRSNIIPVKVLDSNGSGTYADVASGIVYGADKGARVINLSLGGPTSSLTLQNAVTYAVNKNSLVVAAAGNSGSSTPLYPAACSGALAVSATDSSDNLASFSNYGKNVFAGAPGVNITSTYMGSNYKSLSGTSMSAPHLSGMLELALAYISSSSKTVSNTELLNFVKTGTDKVGPYPYDSNGWNQYFGYGRINAQKLFGEIKQAPTSSSTPLTSRTITSSVTTSPRQIGSRSSNGKLKLEVELHGEIDSINQDESFVVIRIKSISQNIKLATDDLVNLYFDNDSEIKYKNGSVNFGELKVGDEVNGKVLFEDDRLTATEVTLQRKGSVAPVITATPNNSNDNSNPSSGNNSNSNSSNSNKNKKTK
jgi:thermitase